MVGEVKWGKRRLIDREELDVTAEDTGRKSLTEAEKKKQMEDV